MVESTKKESTNGRESQVGYSNVDKIMQEVGDKRTSHSDEAAEEKYQVLGADKAIIRVITPFAVIASSPMILIFFHRGEG